MFRQNWQALIKPNKLDLQTDLNTTTVVIEPLERGFGFTLGHALRRTLLSSLPGAAVTTVEISGAPRTFASPEDRLDATIDLILNIKGIAIRMDADASPSHLIARKRGPAILLAGDFQGSREIEILNPDHRICSLDSGHELTLDLSVAYGKGYRPAKPMTIEDSTRPGRILIDALYSPVRHVSVTVENTRQGQVLDYERLILTVETSGAISGEDAIAEAARILHDQLSVFINFEEIAPQPPIPKPRELPFEPVLLRRIDHFELSVRSSNCMKGENIVYLGDLVTISETRLLRVPNFGRKSLNEIKSLLAELGLHLGMDVPEWPPLDITQLEKRYAGEWIV